MHETGGRTGPRRGGGGGADEGGKDWCAPGGVAQDEVERDQTKEEVDQTGRGRMGMRGLDGEEGDGTRGRIGAARRKRKSIHKAVMKT